MARFSHLALATLAVAALALLLGAAPANAQDEVGLPQTYTLPPLLPGQREKRHHSASATVWQPAC